MSDATAVTAGEVAAAPKVKPPRVVPMSLIVGGAIVLASLAIHSIVGLLQNSNRGFRAKAG